MNCPSCGRANRAAVRELAQEQSGLVGKTGLRVAVDAAEEALARFAELCADWSRRGERAHGTTIASPRSE